MTGWRGRKPRRSERGMALLVVVLIMIVVLAGGLAGVALTSGELASARGYRTRQVTEACASQALERVRAALDDAGTAPTYASTDGTLNVGSGDLRYRAGHYGYDEGTSPSVRELDPASVDMTALYEGENITNSLGAGGSHALRVMATSAVCGGSGFGEREMEIVFTFGTGTR